jgi:hypothetical protein
MTNNVNVEVSDQRLIAYCGLYCGTCSKYKKGNCPGCVRNEKATWCKIRSCNMDNGFSNCSACTTNVGECKKLNNVFGKIFGFIFKTDRVASLNFIKQKGGHVFIDKMCDLDQMSIKKGQII